MEEGQINSDSIVGAVTQQGLADVSAAHFERIFQARSGQSVGGHLLAKKVEESPRK